jgi:hypothetical protein
LLAYELKSHLGGSMHGMLGRTVTVLREVAERSVNTICDRCRRVRGGRRVPPVTTDPARHQGATEAFGAELRALRSVEVSPELVTDIETELRWGLLWHDFERAMQDEIDRIFEPYLPVALCRDFDDLREMIGLPELTPA